MRITLLALAVVVSTASLAGSALADGGLSLSIGGSGSKVLYGHDLSLRGRLSNGLSHRSVEVYSRPLGKDRLARIATTTTGSLGGWSLRVAPSVATLYEARSGTAVTPLLSVGVEPEITTRIAARGTVAVGVSAARSLVGRVVELQRKAGPRWTTIETAALDKRAAAVFPAPLSRGSATLRVAMSVNQAGRGYLGASSHAFVYRAMVVSLSASATRVRFGGGLELSGRISSELPGQKVTILVRRYGSPTVTLAAVRSRAGGSWAYPVRPTVETTYDAHWNGIVSANLEIGVEPTLSLTQLGNNRLEVRIAPAARFVDRNVELQRLVAGKWKTIGQAALAGATGGALFAAPPHTGGAALRAAISVNEAGRGYLGATSASLPYRARFVSIVPVATRVLYGHSVALTGRISDARKGEPVSILAWPYGHSAPTRIATLLTGSAGRWSFRPHPSIQTSYTARWGLITSRALVVGVEPRISVARSSGGGIRARIAAAPSLADRTVQLQELIGADRWRTIESARLDQRSNAAFAAPAVSGRHVTLRVALSVNQAGAGLLGATSHAFGYERA